MSNTEIPYRKAGQAAYEAWAGEPAFWNLLSEQDQLKWITVAQRAVKTFHKARKDEHSSSGRDRRPAPR